MFWICVYAFNAYAQETDTVRIYFAYGKSVVPKRQMKKIHRLSELVYLNDLDSVHFVGMTDSTGSKESNIALGRKRAKEVAKWCEHKFTTKPKITITTKGEKNAGDHPRYRRVEVIFYHQVQELPMVAMDTPDQYCFKPADTLMHRSLIRNVKHRRMPHMMVETFYRPTKAYYSAHVDPSTSKPVVQPVRWRKSKPTEYNRYHSDYYALIPAQDYEDFGVFVIDTTDCDTNCGLTPNKYAAFRESVSDKCLQVDRFLMNHLQAKRRWYHAYSTKVRVHRTYVDLNTTYYASCYMQKIEWRSTPSKRKWRRRKRNSAWQRFLNKLFKKREDKLQNSEYLYTDLINRNDCLANITREMDCCMENMESSQCGHCFPFCGGTGGGPVDDNHDVKSVIPLLELGYWNLSDTQSVYAALGFDFSVYGSSRFVSKVRLLGGVSQNENVYAQLQSRNTFLAIPFYGNGGTRWSTLSLYQRPKSWLLTNTGLEATYANLSGNGYRYYVSPFIELEGFRSPVYARTSSVFVRYNPGISPGLTEVGIEPFSYQLGFRYRL